MSERNFPASGTYQAKVTDGQKLVLYQVESSGNLGVAIPVTLLDSTPSWSGKGQIIIAKADGTINTKNVATLRKMFPGWTDASPLQLTELDLTAHTPNEMDNVFEASCVIQPFTPKATDDDPNPQSIDVFKIQWLNPLGGSAAMPEPISKEDLLAKWGAGFKAVFGGAKQPTSKPAAKEENKPAKSSSTAPSRPNKSNAMNPLNTAEKVWEAYRDKMTKDKPKEYPNRKDVTITSQASLDFWDIVDAVQPGNDGANITSASWSAVADSLNL